MMYGNGRWAAVGSRSAAKIAVLPAVVDLDDLMVHRVAAGAPHANARRDLAVLVDQVQDAGLLQRHVVLGEIAGPVPLVGMTGVVPLPAPHAVARVGKTWPHRAVFLARREAAGVVEMEMRGDDQVDVAGADAGGLQRGVERWDVLEGVHRADPRIELPAGTGVDQDRRSAALHQPGPHRHPDAVAVVGRRDLLPQHAGHDPEHGAAIEAEIPVEDGGERQRPQRERAHGQRTSSGAACLSSMSTPCAADG